LQIKLYDAVFPAETAAGSDDTAIMPLDIPEEGAWIFDLSAPMDVEGFIFTPQENVPPGTPVTYSFYGSNDGQNWELLAQGEFGNIVNNPVSQRVEFACKILRFCKLTSSRMTGKSDSIQGKAFALLRK
jgi:alpha-L-fucosidase